MKKSSSLKNNLTIILSFIFVAVMAAQVKAQEKAIASLAQPGYYHMILGDIEITALSDGTIPQDLNALLKDAKPGEVSELLTKNYQSSTIECSVNAYLIKTGGKLILIDVGTSGVFGPGLGHLTENLAKAGYKPEQIDAILLTHIHMDHIGGLMNGDQITFPNAQVYISKLEADYWLNAANKAKSAPAMQRFFDDAALKLSPILKAGKLKTFDFGAELFPGITPIASFGHTPGHSFYAVESKGQKIIFWGDISVSAPVQFADPDITSVYDYNPKEAAATRKKALAEAAKNGYWVAVSHISFPGIGHIITNGTSYNWAPINYSSNGVGQ